MQSNNNCITPTSSSSRFLIEEACARLKLEVSAGEMLKFHTDILLKFFAALNEIEEEENKKQNSRCCELQ